MWPIAGTSRRFRYVTCFGYEYSFPAEPGAFVNSTGKERNMRNNEWRRRAGWLALATVIGVAGCASDSGQGPGKSAGAYVDDSMITAKVKTAFVEDKDVSALNIGVTTSQGVVQLTGSGTAAEARRATDIARHIEGVKAVQNNIRAK